MISTSSAPPTSLNDCILLVVLSVPAALILHAAAGATMFRAAKASNQFSEASYRKLYWSIPVLFLTWTPWLVAALGCIGCSLMRDAGYLVFPWPLFSVAILCGVTSYLCHLLRQRMVRRNFPPVAQRSTEPIG